MIRGSGSIQGLAPAAAALPGKEESPSASLVSEIVGAPEYKEPPFALSAPMACPLCRRNSNNAKSGTWRYSVKRALIGTRWENRAGGWEFLIPNS